MKALIKIKQRCLFCKKKLKQGDEILIHHDNTVIHKKCVSGLKRVVEKNVGNIQ